MSFQEFIKPELLILIPVLYLIGIAVKKSNISDKIIPVILGAISIALCALWVFATSTYSGGQEIATAIFIAITQGVLIAGASVYANQIVKQSTKEE